MRSAGVRRKSDARGTDKAFRELVCEQELLACCWLCPDLVWAQEVGAVGIPWRQCQRQLVQALDQEGVFHQHTGLLASY